jgi:hypothetical protein
VATLFMVVVIPVALNAMRVASMAGEAAQRKLVAARIANGKLNELKVTSQLLNGGQRGIIWENGVSYTWTQKSEFWNADPVSRMTLGTVMVEYSVAGRHCNVELSTLAPPRTR